MYQMFIDDLMDITNHWRPVSQYTGWFYHKIMAPRSMYHAGMALEHDALYADIHARHRALNCMGGPIVGR